MRTLGEVVWLRKPPVQMEKWRKWGERRKEALGREKGSFGWSSTQKKKVGEGNRQSMGKVITDHWRVSRGDFGQSVFA